MSGVLDDAPTLGEPWICPKCTGARGAHYLTCPVLQLAPGWNETCAPSPGAAAR